MKLCIVGVRRPSDPESPSGKGTPAVWFPSMATMAAVLSADNLALLRMMAASFKTLIGRGSL